VKSPDKGFYAIRYTHSTGDKGGQTSDFNPDFILYDQRLEPRRSHIYLVEMKDEGDTRNQNRDKVNAADAYAKRLNEAVTDDRPTYSFHLLTPGDVLPFFTALREGTAESYVGMLHQILCSAPVQYGSKVRRLWVNPGDHLTRSRAPVAANEDVPARAG
jgi:hypothetical protein